MRNLKKIALIFAMSAEAMPIIEALGLKKDESFGNLKLPFQYYRGHFKNKIELLVSLNGKDVRYGVDNIGTEPATLNAYLTLSSFNPDLCINLGTAGGFIKKQAQIGDVYLSAEAFRFHDRRIPIPGFDQYGVGHYPIFHIPQMAAALGLKEGVVTTSNALDATDKDLEMIHKNNGAIKEMEAAAVAWVAHLLNIPIFALKAITDHVDSNTPTAEEFIKNLNHACESLKVKTLAVLEYLNTNTQIY